MTTTQAAATPETPNSGLKTRARSALIMMAVFLTLLGFGGFSYAILIAAMGSVACFEWARMVAAKGENHPLSVAPMAAAVGAFGIITAGMVVNPVLSLIFTTALCFLLFAVNYVHKGKPVRPLVTGVLYIGFACSIMIWLRNDVPSGLFHTLTLLFIVWASDISAYFTGRTLGGPKLAPAISPKKTWSGFIGSSVGAGLVAGAMVCPWMVAKLDIQTVFGMGSPGYFIMGFILAMFGQAGDLLISVFKRHFDVKDTGALIPGHGGVLDRIDALILVTLIFGSLVRLSF